MPMVGIVGEMKYRKENENVKDNDRNSYVNNVNTLCSIYPQGNCITVCWRCVHTYNIVCDSFLFIKRENAAPLWEGIRHLELLCYVNFITRVKICQERGKKTMKRSEIYELALHAVLKDVSIVNSKKLEIIRELQDKQGTALFMEKKEEEQEHYIN